MSNQPPHVVIVDTNEDYAFRLEDKFLRTMRYNVDLDVITNRTCFEKFFSVPVHIDVALITEDFIDADIVNHDIVSLYVLSEDEPKEADADDKLKHIYKYTSLSHVFNQTMGSFSHLIKSQSRHAPRLLVFFSPVGGSGKTTLAAAVAACLQEDGNKVLYMDVEYQQETGKLFSNVHAVPASTAMAFMREPSDPYREIKQQIIHDVIDVIPPLESNIMMYGVTFGMLVATLEGAKRSGDYDYVIADTDSCFNEDKLALVQKADAVIVPTTQDLIAVKKTCAFVDGLDTNGRSKCHLVCNYYDDKNSRGYEGLFSKQGYAIEAQIRRDERIKSFNAEDFARHDDFLAVAYLVR